MLTCFLFPCYFVDMRYHKRRTNAEIARDTRKSNCANHHVEACHCWDGQTEPMLVNVQTQKENKMTFEAREVKVTSLIRI